MAKIKKNLWILLDEGEENKIIKILGELQEEITGVKIGKVAMEQATKEIDINILKTTTPSGVVDWMKQIHKKFAAAEVTIKNEKSFVTLKKKLKAQGIKKFGFEDPNRR